MALVHNRQCSKWNASCCTLNFSLKSGWYSIKRLWEDGDKYRKFERNSKHISIFNLPDDLNFVEIWRYTTSDRIFWIGRLVLFSPSTIEVIICLERKNSDLLNYNMVTYINCCYWLILQVQNSDSDAMYTFTEEILCPTSKV